MMANSERKKKPTPEIDKDVGYDPAAGPVAPGLIDKATTSTSHEVDPRLLRAIKSAARSSDTDLRAAFEALMYQLRRPHSHVRYLSLLIVDELFSRSALFRSLLAPDLDRFLALTVGFRRDLPLPPPAASAARLRSKSIELLEKWTADFGARYRQLRLGFDYLKNTLKFQFPNRLENAARAQQERREREARSQLILRKKLESLRENWSSIKLEIQSTVDEIGECLEIVSNDAEKDDFVANVEDEDGEEFVNSMELRQIRLDSLKEGKKVRESSENRAVFDALRELYKLLVSKHLTTVQQWMSVLVRVDAEDSKFRDDMLKEFIDLRNVIQSVKKKCGDLGCDFNEKPRRTEEGDEEDLWEEGKIEVSVSENPSLPEALVEDAPSGSKGMGKEKGKGKEKQKIEGDDGKCSLRSKLLAEAPVLDWGSSLDDWGSSGNALANHRGLELESHWGRVDPDAVIPAEKIAELKLHRTLYKEEIGEIQPCLSPLRKGGLCQRRDLRVCPFHGPIIPRDTEGNPIEQKMEALPETEEEFVEAGDGVVDSVDVGSSPEPGMMVEKLARQAVKNVRERDREVVKSLKRTKAAKVREHNEVVLRESAIASTSYSETSRENADVSSQFGSDTKGKKVTLASMLKKKVTTKDRLAKRLLNTHVRDASSRQVTEGEDSKYREAFPNQW